MRKSIPLVLIFVLLVAFRVLGSLFPESLPNFQPLMAAFLCVGIATIGWRGLAFVAAAWLLTYPLPALIEGNSSFLRADALITVGVAAMACFALGRQLKNCAWPAVLGGAIAAAVAFHLITNSVDWISSPLYPNNPHGLWQSLWTGPLGSPLPSWVFLKNSLVSNLLFTSMFLLARVPIRAAATAATASAGTVGAR